MKLSSILLSVAEIIIFACWFFFPLQHFNLLQEQHSDLQQTTDCHWRGRKTDKNWVLYPNHQNECCWCLGLVWRRSSSSLVLSPQTQLEIQNKKHLVWGKLFKMNLDVRPQCILVNHKAAVQSFLMKLRFQNSEPDSLTLSDAQRWRGFYPALLLSLV